MNYYSLDTIKGDEVYDGTIPERNSGIIRSEGTPKLLAVSAYKQTAEKLLILIHT